jgi:hypothetical protein
VGRRATHYDFQPNPATRFYNFQVIWCNQQRHK